MTTPSRIYGLSAVAQAAVSGDQTTGISAAGTTQATATALTTDANFISTCAAAAGVILPIGENGKTCHVYNGGVGICYVYPPVGGTINQNATNILYALAPGTAGDFTYSAALTISTVSPEALPRTKYVATTAGTSTLAAGDMTGAQNVFLAASGGTTPSLTTRTATQLYGDVPNASVGSSYFFRIINTNSGTLTLVMDASVTATGTLTVATNTTRDFVVTFTSATAATMKCVGVGTIS